MVKGDEGDDHDQVQCHGLELDEDLRACQQRDTGQRRISGFEDSRSDAVTIDVAAEGDGETRHSTSQCASSRRTVALLTL